MGLGLGNHIIKLDSPIFQFLNRVDKRNLLGSDWYLYWSRFNFIYLLIYQIGKSVKPQINVAVQRFEIYDKKGINIIHLAVVMKLGSHFWGLSDKFMVCLCSEIRFLEVFEKI